MATCIPRGIAGAAFVGGNGNPVDIECQLDQEFSDAGRLVSLP
jgi:hypothetical protein